jgi:hypothetical protein
MLILGAAWVQAVAAIAMWKATINLVRTSRDMILANIPPRVCIRLQNSQPFEDPKDSTVIVRNDGSVDLDNVLLDVGPSFESNDHNAYSKITTRLKVGTLKAGKEFKFRIWDFAKAAAQKQEQLPESYSHVRNYPFAQVEVLVSFRHSATGALHEVMHLFLTEFSTTGQLNVCESFPAPKQKEAKNLN